MTETFDEEHLNKLRELRRQISKEWRDSHRDIVRKTARDYYKKRKEEDPNYGNNPFSKVYYEKNRDKILEKQRERNKTLTEEQRQKRRDTSKKYRDSHVEELRLKGKQYKEEHKEEVREKSKIKSKLENYKDKRREYDKNIVVCKICGTSITHGCLYKHYKTNKCKSHVNVNSLD